MPISFELESIDQSGGRRALIIIPPGQNDPELVFNIDTYQNVSESEEKSRQKKENELEKAQTQLKRAEEVGDDVAVERLENQIKFSGGKTIADQILKYDNLLFSKLSDKTSEILYRYYSDIQLVIHNLSIDNRSSTMATMTAMTTEMMNTINLAGICIDFVKWIKPPLPDAGIIGRRQHHSAAKTFEIDDPKNPDYLDMTALAIFSKIMFPVWGQYCHRMKTIGVGNMDKEFYCLLFAEPGLMQSKLGRIYNKFRAYVFSEVTRAMNKSARNPYGNESNFDRNMFTLGKQIYNEDQFQSLNLAKIIVKRLVGFDIESSSLKGENNIPNVMIYCQAIIEKNVTNTLKQFNANNALLTRDEPRGGGDDNFTFMENCSRISQFSPDCPIITRVGAEVSIPRKIVEEGLNLDEFNEIVNFYHGERILRKNVFTDAVLGVFLFPIIGSSKNLNHLKAKQYIMAVAYVQLLLLARKQEPYSEALALMLSAGQSESPRTNKVDAVSASILNTSEKCVEYRELMDRFPHSCEMIVLNESIIGSKPRGTKKDKIKGTINISRHVTVIRDWLIDYDHYVNLCPVLWKYLPVRPGVPRPKQNDILQYSTEFMVHYYQFILHSCPEAQEEETETDRFFRSLP